MRVRVVLDTCALYPTVLRDVLVRCAENGLFEPRWSDAILDELVQAIARNRPDIEFRRLLRLCALMNQAFPEALTASCPGIDISEPLPDPKDAHVLAVVVASCAAVLVTLNVRHFPTAVMARYTAARTVTPDAFLLGFLDEDPEAALDAVRRAAADMRRPAVPLGQVIEMLERSVPRFAAVCRSRFGVE